MSEWQDITLDDALNFYNGKTIDYTKGGEYPVFGSNGQVGSSAGYKYENIIHSQFYYYIKNSKQYKCYENVSGIC